MPLAASHRAKFSRRHDEACRTPHWHIKSNPVTGRDRRNAVNGERVPEAVMHSFPKRASLIWWRVGIMVCEREGPQTAGWEAPPCVAEQGAGNDAVPEPTQLHEWDWRVDGECRLGARNRG
jgi:hypothetical protein